MGLTVTTPRPTVPAPRRRDAARAADPTVWIPAVAAVLLALDRQGPLVAAVLGVAVAIHPGVLIVDALRPIDRLERVVATLALSVVAWMVVAHVLLTVRWWHPGPVAATVLAACAVARLAMPGRPAGERAPAAVPRNPRGLAATVVVSAVALALWAWSVSGLDVGDIGLLGLAPELPPSWFAALALATIGAACAATTPHTSAARLIASVVPLLVIVYGTIVATTGTIRYPWAYKHVGVIRLLDETGRLHPDVDIYNNFSGFFGLLALVRGATGVDPVSYAAWAQLAGEALVLVAVAYLVHRVTGSVRVAYLTVVLYLLTNWVGQNYFAAQTLGSFLALVTLGMVWSWFRRTVGTPERRAHGPGHDPRDHPGDGLPAPTPAGRRLAARRRLAVAAVFLGLLMTHPLTPVVVVGAFVAAVALGWVRDRWLLIALVAVGLLWFARSFSYFAAQDFDLGFGGSPAANAAGNKDVSLAPGDSRLISGITRYYSVGVWLLAVAGGAVAAWARRRIGLLVVLATIPFGIPLVQSYGGEAIYRVYLYSLPLMTALIAWGVVSSAPVARRDRMPQPTALASALCLVLALGFVVVHYGRERINQVDTSEVAMDAYIDAMVPRPAILAQFSAGYPAQSGARYPDLQVTDTYTPYVTEMLGPRATLPGPGALDAVADDLVALTAGTAYVVVSPGMIDDLAVSGDLPVHSSDQATRFLLSNPRFELVTRIDDTYLLRVRR